MDKTRRGRTLLRRKISTTRRRTLWGRATFRIITAVSMLGLAACGGGTTGGTGHGALTPVTMRLDFTPGGHQAPFFLALERGYYKDVGLDVTIGPGRGSAITAQSVASGQDDFGHVNIGPALSAMNEGQPLKVIATLTNRNSWVVYVDKGSGIKNLKDLYGKQVLLAAGTPDPYLTQAVFSINGLDVGRVTLQNVDSASKFALYTQRKADGLITSVPYGDPIIQPKRPSDRLAYADFGLTLVDYGLVTNQNMIDKHPDVVKAFAQATIRGYKAAIKDPAAAAAAVSKHWDKLSEEVIRQQWELQMDHIGVPETKGLPVGCSTEGLWKKSIETLNKYAGTKLDANHLDKYYTEGFIDCSR